MPRSRPKHVKQRPPDPDALDAPWRLFVAVPLPESVIQLVGHLIEDLRQEGWPVRWSDPDTAHITLQFIGEVPAERAELLKMALPGVVAEHHVFNLRTAGPGVFPNVGRPRVLWLGLHGPTHRLDSIHAAVTNLLTQLEFPLDPKPFHPHITLGRVRDTHNAPTRHLPEAIRRKFAEEAEKGRASAKNPVPIPVDEVVLMRSILSREGAQHQPLVRCPLARPMREPARRRD
jgi:2'-5' RNA ligase